MGGKKDGSYERPKDKGNLITDTPSDRYGSSNTDSPEQCRGADEVQSVASPTPTRKNIIQKSRLDHTLAYTAQANEDEGSPLQRRVSVDDSIDLPETQKLADTPSSERNHDNTTHDAVEQTTQYEKQTPLGEQLQCTDALRNADGVAEETQPAHVNAALLILHTVMEIFTFSVNEINATSLKINLFPWLLKPYTSITYAIC
uniref:Uncharacterized protein n=1 Tax=Trichogramma kaykai TaxID=54128 RepID=A0ABD2W910_9HYME